MSWLDEAKGRVEEVARGDITWNGSEYRHLHVLRVQISADDAPRAYALLERAKYLAMSIMDGENCSDRATLAAAAALNRDLEGKAAHQDGARDDKRGA